MGRVLADGAAYRGGGASVSLPKCISVTIFISELKFSIRASKDLTELR